MPLMIRALGLMQLRTDSPRPLSFRPEDLNKPRVELWITSEERQWYMGRRANIIDWVAVGVLLTVVASAIAITLNPGNPRRWWAVVTGAAAVAVLGWSTVPYWVARRAFTARKRAMATYLADVALDEVCRAPHDPLPLSGLFQLNRRQLDEYQQLTKRQQQQAFRMTWAAAAAGFAVLVAGIVLAITAKHRDQRYLVSGLTALSSVISGYLGKTFYDGHRNAMRQLNIYYREPYMTGRALAVERIASKLGERPATRAFARR